MMTQQILEIPGTHKERFYCNRCGFPCEVTETVKDGVQTRTVPPGCQRFPSLPPSWIRVE